MKENVEQVNKHGIQVAKGDTLVDKYLVLAHISTGGMSEVFLVEEIEHPGNRWAVKIVNTTHPLASKLKDEATFLSELEHTNLPFVVDFSQDENYLYLIMEYINRVSLYDLLAIYNNQLPVSQVIQIGKQVCDVLEFLHSQQPHPIIYRDIKPGNILINEDETIKLIDFGTARRYQEEELTDTVRIGTVGFAAPEQFEKKQTDERTDLFSLGALLYYLLSEGRYVYVAQEPINKLHKGLPKSLKKCVNRLVELKPDARPQTAHEVKTLLLQAEDEWNGKLLKRRGNSILSYLFP